MSDMSLVLTLEEDGKKDGKIRGDTYSVQKRHIYVRKDNIFSEYQFRKTYIKERKEDSR